MNMELTQNEFRLLLDLVYVGNWVMNSARGNDRIEPYDQLQEKLFSLCGREGMPSLVQVWRGHCSRIRSEEYQWKDAKNLRQPGGPDRDIN